MRIRRLFSKRNVLSTLGIIVVFVGSLSVTILGILEEISDSTLLNAILALLTFMAFSEIVERVGSLAQIEKHLERIDRRLGLDRPALSRAGQFTPIEDFFKGSEDILIIGLTKIGLVVQRMNFFTEMIESGRTIRLGLLNPEEDKLYELVSNNLEIGSQRFLTDIEQTIATLKGIRYNLTEGENTRLIVKFYSASPGLGLIMVDSHKPTGRLQVYFYAYQTDPSMRPGFEIHRKDDPEWFDFFVSTYLRFWDEISPDRESDITKPLGRD